MNQDQPSTPIALLRTTASKIWFACCEWRASRAGKVRVRNTIAKPARDVVGAIGHCHSRTWDRMVEGSEAYTRSFEPRIPPSLHISARDEIRSGTIIPMAERRIADWTHQHGDPNPAPEDTGDGPSDGDGGFEQGTP